MRTNPKSDGYGNGKELSTVFEAKPVFYIRRGATSYFKCLSPCPPVTLGYSFLKNHLLPSVRGLLALQLFIPFFTLCSANNIVLGVTRKVESGGR